MAVQLVASSVIGSTEQKVQVAGVHFPRSCTCSPDVLPRVARQQALILTSIQLASFAVVRLQVPFAAQGWSDTISSIQAPFQQEWLLPGARRRTVRGRRKLLGLLPGQSYQVVEPGAWWTPSGLVHRWQALSPAKWTVLLALLLALLLPTLQTWWKAHRRQQAGMRELLADNAHSLAQQRSRLQQALVGRAAVADGVTADTSEATTGVQDGLSQSEEPAVREAEVQAQWAAFMQGSKVMQIQPEQWWDLDSVEERWPPRSP